MIGMGAGSPSATACAALVGSASRYPPIPTKLFGRHQCARTIGHVTGGILRISPTSRVITDSPRPLLSLPIHWGTRLPPLINKASAARTTPRRANQAPRLESLTPRRSILVFAGDALSHSA